MDAPSVPQPEEKVFTLAEALANGKPVTQHARDTALLELVTRAQAGGASWELIGRFLGVPGWEAKKAVKKLEARVKRAGVTETDDQPRGT